MMTHYRKFQIEYVSGWLPIIPELFQDKAVEMWRIPHLLWTYSMSTDSTFLQWEINYPFLKAPPLAQCAVCSCPKRFFDLQNKQNT